MIARHNYIPLRIWIPGAYLERWAQTQEARGSGPTREARPHGLPRVASSPRPAPLCPGRPVLSLTPAADPGGMPGAANEAN